MGRGIGRWAAATVVALAIGCDGGGLAAPRMDAAADGGRPRSDAAARDEGALDAARAADSGLTEAGTGDAGTDAARPPLRDDALEPGYRWDEKAARVLDSDALPGAFTAAGWAPPEGSEIFAARIVPGVEGPAYVLYEAGGGAFSQDFWPASTIKLIAALGMLELLDSHGFSGDATVEMAGGYSDAVHNIYERSIRVSSNIDYDRTVRIAGFDWLNAEFLVASRGFPNVVIQRSYSGTGVRSSPWMQLHEDGATHTLEARTGSGDYGCGDDGNCANLFELTDALRRVVLHDEVPETHRFALADADVERLVDALCTASPSFFAEGAAAALGSTPRICHKPGWVPYLDCLDHGLIQHPDTGERFLLAAATPELEGTRECAGLEGIARHVLSALQEADGGLPLQHDAGVPITVQLDYEGRDADGRRRYTIGVDAGGADRVQLYADTYALAEASGGPRFTLEHAFHEGGERLLIVRAFREGEPVGYRALRVAIEP